MWDGDWKGRGEVRMGGRGGGVGEFMFEFRHVSRFEFETGIAFRFEFRIAFEYR